eukprot:5837741-Prymnesium_polylepis.1
MNAVSPSRETTGEATMGSSVAYDHWADPVATSRAKSFPDCEPMSTEPPLSNGDESTGPPVSNFQLSDPLARSAYTKPSNEPMTTVPSAASAGE